MSTEADTELRYEIFPFRYSEAAEEVYAIRSKENHKFWYWCYESEEIAEAVIQKIMRTYAFDVCAAEQKVTADTTIFTTVSLEQVTRNG